MTSMAFMRFTRGSHFPQSDANPDAFSHSLYLPASWLSPPTAGSLQIRAPQLVRPDRQLAVHETGL